MRFPLLEPVQEVQKERESQEIGRGEMKEQGERTLGLGRFESPRSQFRVGPRNLGPRRAPAAGRRP